MDVHRDRRLRPPLGEDREAAVSVAAGLGDDAFGDLLLEHQRERPPPGRPAIERHPADEQRGADIIGQVRCDVRAFARFGALINLHGVVGQHPEAPARRLVELGQRRQAPVVALDRHHIRPRFEQRAGQPAGAGADFIDGRAVQIAGNAGDTVEQLAVEQEILPERLAGAQAMPRDHLAQRRQAGNGFGLHDRAITDSAGGFARPCPRAKWRRSSRPDGPCPCRRSRKRCHDRGRCARSAARASCSRPRRNGAS